MSEGQMPDGQMPKGQIQEGQMSKALFGDRLYEHFEERKLPEGALK